MALYWIFSIIDWIVFSLSGQVLKLIMDIAAFDFFSEAGFVDLLADRVYGVLAVVMLFKVMISFIQYLVNPESMGDKSNGIGSLLQNTVICFALLALVPTIFDFARDVQDRLVKAIPQIILGYDSVDGDNIEETGNIISFQTLKSFLAVKDEYKEKYSLDKGDESTIKNFNTFRNNIALECSDSILDWLDTSECAFEYKFLISTISGAFLLYITVSMAVDVAIRTIKFGILELLAPIPVASYMDPKAREISFKAWIKLCKDVYLDLFTRLALIYFILLFFNKLFSSTTLDALKGKNPWMLLFIILGLFYFIKQAPKFICDALGIKSDGAGFKDMFTRPLGWAGTAKAGFDAARSNYTTQRERLQGQNKRAATLKALFSAGVGAGSAVGRGLKQSVWNGKGFKETYQNAFQGAIKARDKRNEEKDSYTEEYGKHEYRRDKRRAALGIPTSSGFIDSQTKKIDEIAKSFADAKNHGAKKMNETPDKALNMAGGFGVVTDGDGLEHEVNNISIAQARAMSAIQVGSLYDDGKANERAARIISDAESNYRRMLSNYDSMKKLAARNPDAVSDASMRDMEFQLEMAKNDLMNKKANENTIGLVAMTKEANAQWQAVQQKIEKEYSYVMEADLLKSGKDPDAIKGHELSIKLLRDNKTLFTNNPEYNKILKDNNFDSIEDLLNTFNRRNADGNYDMTADELKRAKTAFEAIGAAAYPEYLKAKDRAEKASKAQQDANK